MAYLDPERSASVQRGRHADVSQVQLTHALLRLIGAKAYLRKSEGKGSLSVDGGSVRFPRGSVYAAWDIQGE